MTTPGLVDATVRLCRMLRARGVPVTLHASIDAMRALRVVDITDRREVHHALRAVLATRIEDYHAFDAAFDATFRADAVPAPDIRPGRGPERRAPALRGSALERWVSRAAPAEDSMAMAAMSELESTRGTAPAGYSPEELSAMLRVARRMARRLALSPARRWQASPRGRALDARRTLLRALRTGGDPVLLLRRRRRIRKARLFVLCDVSGSMDLYARFLIQLLYALQDSFARVETFVFSTRLTRVTAQLRTLTFAEALARLREVRGFSSGTKIGESLAEFAREWERHIDTRSIVLILSDGWDTGEPARVAGVMQRLQRRARRVIWLNPLLGSPGYQPLAAGMQAALPYIDVFAPGHDFESLRAMIRYLNV